MKDLPSEEKLVLNGNGSATGDDGKVKKTSAS
jgi:ATP-dependent Clp protease protease subunit